ncbi:metallophosphoesterase [Longimicrobium terrae]|uniref:Calcineurin-like phosphoesterase domain-containing protein n=1 Tax=Longimicrobium terrae TaxID=1639882 RepID=A0A841H6F5_9BACT|nr:metallophosphoesterase [Longimicrobium terrae]MBB4639252.1 hypothetical protein [Longimicrobium terrae]MBB6073492.1 hypothetical protein [Longimicrobium terrae]NNC32258.1 hypothetical protein [Longimicrobium terrae]
MRIATTITLVALSACAEPVLTRPAPAPLPPTPGSYELRLGLISDSQLQTLKAPGQIAFLRRRLDDHLVAVALRPPAVDIAGRFMMEAQLEHLSDSEIIIYTGDAANNGCEDEITEAFEVLSAFRSRTRVPLFFVIGNHDYLGAGNTSNLNHRNPLCGEGNRPLTKLDLIRRAHAFNQENLPLLGVGSSFVDSFSELTVASCENANAGRGIDPQDQHLKPGCFLSGVISLENGEQILLLDSSDYADVEHRPTEFRRLTRAEFAGLRGSVSFHDSTSQGEWLRKHMPAIAPKIRIIASHYNLDGMRWNLLLFKPGTLVGIPSQYLNPEPELGNHWVYGHTHTAQPTTDLYDPALKYCRQGICEAALHEEVNVGSTTDWWPHSAIAYVGRSTTVVPFYLGEKCGTFMDLIKKEAANAGRRYGIVNGHEHGIVLFGLDRSYQQYRDGERDRVAAYNNARLLAAEAITAGHAATLSDAWVCLGFVGSWYERVGGRPRL